MNEHYKKMKEKGFICKKVWIRPEYETALKDVQQYFKQEGFEVFYYNSSFRQGLSIERHR
jgi:hypothetical protein